MSAQTYTREEILAALVLEPCHISGTHDPQHTTKYICRDQQSVALARLLALLEVTVEELPRRLDPDCGWCRDGEDLPLLIAWADRRPMTFTLHVGTSFDAPPVEGEGFPTYMEAWERGFDLKLGKFSICVAFDGLDAPRRVGYSA